MRLAMVIGPKCAQRAVLVHHLVIRIRQQVEGQAVLGAELLVAVGRVHAHAQNHGVLGLELGQIVLEVVGLDGAARGHVLGIEVEHHPLAVVAASAKSASPSCEGSVNVGAAWPTAGIVSSAA